MNLLTETLDELKRLEMTTSDVLFCVLPGGWFDWESFAALAKDIDYHEGYGVAEISEDLEIHTTKGIFYRQVYDGAEWWSFIFTAKPEKNIMPTNVR